MSEFKTIIKNHPELYEITEIKGGIEIEFDNHECHWEFINTNGVFIKATKFQLLFDENTLEPRYKHNTHNHDDAVFSLSKSELFKKCKLVKYDWWWGDRW